MRNTVARIITVATLGFLVGQGCAASAPSPSPQRERDARTSASRRIDPRQAARLERVMVPLIKAMNHPIPLNKVGIGIVADPDINAANAGGGEFYVTTGLLLAHEIAHDDLGHAAKAQILGTGLNLGVVLLEQLIPGSSAVTPIAGTLITKGYSRSEEYEADQHGVEILRRAGYPKEVMTDALAWVMQISGRGGGGFLSTHPALEERIETLKRMR